MTPRPGGGGMLINRRAAVAALLGMLALAAPAGASTVSLGFELRYAAAPGEANDLTVTHLDSPVGRTVLHDPGATIAAGSNCQSIDDHTARCDGVPIGYSAI